MNLPSIISCFIRWNSRRTSFIISCFKVSNSLPPLTGPTASWPVSEGLRLPHRQVRDVNHQCINLKITSVVKEKKIGAISVTILQL